MGAEADFRAARIRRLRETSGNEAKQHLPESSALTLIVAVKCSDGVVVGADSLATLGNGGSATVQESTQKVFVSSGSRILAVTGPVGLAQRYHEVIDAVPEAILKTNKPMQIAVQISGEFWQHAQVEYQRSGLVSQATNSSAPLSHAHHMSLVALRCTGEDRLFQFSETCAPEEATLDLPYVSLGSGQSNADPFLAFMRTVFWGNTDPTVPEAIFVVNWALMQASRATPGIGGDPQIAVLQNGHARVLDEDELIEHTESMKDAERVLRDWRNDVSSGTKSDGTAPPTPPKS